MTIREFLQLMIDAFLMKPKPTPNPTPTPTPTPVPTGDAYDLSKIVWNTGEKIGHTTPIKAKLISASMDNKYIYTQYEKYNWPGVSTGEGKPVCDAWCFFFYEMPDGSVHGSRFDWWRAGGQGKKGLENIHNGYHGLIMPEKGRKIYTMISKTHGGERSNIIEVKDNR